MFQSNEIIEELESEKKKELNQKNFSVLQKTFANTFLQKKRKHLTLN